MPVTAGNELVVLAFAGAGRLHWTISDSLGNTYQSLPTASSGTTAVTMFYAESVDAGTDALSVSVSGLTNLYPSLSVVLLELSGLAPTSSLDIVGQSAPQGPSDVCVTSLIHTGWEGELSFAIFNDATLIADNGNAWQDLRAAGGSSGTNISPFAGVQQLGPPRPLLAGERLQQEDQTCAALVAVFRGAQSTRPDGGPASDGGLNGTLRADLGCRCEPGSADWVPFGGLLLFGARARWRARPRRGGPY
jgi:hypothetical protein